MCNRVASQTQLHNNRHPIFITSFANRPVACASSATRRVPVMGTSAPQSRKTTCSQDEWVQDNGHSITPQNSQVQAAKVDTAAFKLESCAGTCWMDYAVARYLLMLLTKRRAGTACGLVMMLRLPKKFNTKKQHRKKKDNHGMVST